MTGCKGEEEGKIKMMKGNEEKEVCQEKIRRKVRKIETPGYLYVQN